MLPTRSWKAYEDGLRLVGEQRFAGDAEVVRTLAMLNLVETAANGEPRLTGPGREYFNARFVQGKCEEAVRVLCGLLIDYAPAAAILQLLGGVKGATRQTAETVLRSEGFGDALNERRLGSLLALMNHAGVIAYSPKTGSLQVLRPLNEAAEVPRTTFVSPKTPYGNRAWLRRLMGEAEGHIYWLDKHFMPVAFEAIWEAADANRISEVRILSLRLEEHQGRRTMRDYRDLVKELGERGIDLAWRTVDSKLMRNTHDRWIIGKNRSWNVPNVNAIYSGQHSEMHRTDNRDELEQLFEEYWSSGVPIDD